MKLKFGMLEIFYFIRFWLFSPVSSCPDNFFRCSPVQCIPRERVCDKKIDCQNRRDEYCCKTTWLIIQNSNL